MSFYLRAVCSCIPLIGPKVTIYNYQDLQSDLNLELKPHELDRNTADNRIAHLSTQTYFNQSNDFLKLNGSYVSDDNTRATIQSHIQELSDSRAPADTAIKNAKILAYKKGRVFALTGLIGKVLSVAILIAALVSAALSGVLVVGAAVSLSLALTGYTAFAIYSGYKLYHFHKNVKQLQAS